MEFFIIVIACFFGATGVLFGTISAHFLDKLIPMNRLEKAKISMDTAVRYEFFHALLLLIIGSLLSFVFDSTDNIWMLKLVALMFIIGVFLFAGLIYLQNFTTIQYFNNLVPVGGTIILIAWILLPIALFII